MVHQPFETWILSDQPELDPAQAAELQAHLENCLACRSLSQSWGGARRELQAAPQAAPAPGFTQRFQSALIARRARQHQLQVRRLLLGLGTAGVLLAVVLSGYLLTKFSPVGLLVTALDSGMQAVNGLTTLIQFMRTWLSAVPFSLTLITWILMTTGMTIAITGWIFTLWRISTQGAPTK